MLKQNISLKQGCYIIQNWIFTKLYCVHLSTFYWSLLFGTDALDEHTKIQSFFDMSVNTVFNMLSHHKEYAHTKNKRAL